MTSEGVVAAVLLLLDIIFADCCINLAQAPSTVLATLKDHLLNLFSTACRYSVRQRMIDLSVSLEAYDSLLSIPEPFADELLLVVESPTGQKYSGGLPRNLSMDGVFLSVSIARGL